MTTKNKEMDSPSFNKDSIGNTKIVFDSEHMKCWVKLRLIPKRLTDAFFEALGKNRKNYERIIEFKKDNPKATFEEMSTAVFRIPRIAAEKEINQLQNEVKMQVELHKFMETNWEKLAKAVSNQPGKGLFKDVKNEKNFGVARIETDPIVRLRDLLDNMRALQIGENEFKARGEIKNSKGSGVVLEFELKAKNQEEAAAVISAYKKMMMTKGIRAFLAYWKIANEKGGLSFDCSISEVMALIADEDRNSYFTDKNRSEFWGITRALAATKFMLEWPAKPIAGRRRRNRTRPNIEWIEQPLIQIHGGETELGEECPIRISATVLATESANRRFSPAIIVNETLRLHPSDVYFAFIIQSRAAQMGNGGKEISYDWNYAFAAANVEGTARRNPTKAKAAVRKKLTNYRKEKIIEKSRDDASRVYIIPRSQKKTKNKQSKNDS